jgi:chromosome partitioning protein
VSEAAHDPVDGEEPATNAFERVPRAIPARTLEFVPRVVAVAAHKGGVGKTTTALSLAAAFARGGRGSTLLIDLDPQAHCTIGLGLELEGEDRHRTVRELLDRRRPASLHQVVFPTSVPNLQLLPASIALEAAAQALVGQTMRHAVLNDALAAAVGTFAWIVIDCPPSLGPLVENALWTADLIIIPCRMEARATDGLQDLVDMLRLLRGRAFDEWRILRTAVDSHNKVANEAIGKALTEHYPAWMLKTFIPRSEALNKSQIARVDIYEFDRDSAGALAYFALAVEVEEWHNASYAKRISSGSR